jgi:hypothetical protein
MGVGLSAFSLVSVRFLLLVGMYSYTDLEVRVLFVLNKCCAPAFKICSNFI